MISGFTGLGKSLKVSRKHKVLTPAYSLGRLSSTVQDP